VVQNETSQCSRWQAPIVSPLLWLNLLVSKWFLLRAQRLVVALSQLDCERANRARRVSTNRLLVLVVEPIFASLFLSLSKHCGQYWPGYNGFGSITVKTMCSDTFACPPSGLLFPLPHSILLVSNYQQVNLSNWLSLRKIEQALTLGQLLPINHSLAFALSPLGSKRGRLHLSSCPLLNLVLRFRC